MWRTFRSGLEIQHHHRHLMIPLAFTRDTPSLTHPPTGNKRLFWFLTRTLFTPILPLQGLPLRSPLSPGDPDGDPPREGEHLQQHPQQHHHQQHLVVAVVLDPVQPLLLPPEVRGPSVPDHVLQPEDGPLQRRLWLVQERRLSESTEEEESRSNGPLTQVVPRLRTSEFTHLAAALYCGFVTSSVTASTSWSTVSVASSRRMPKPSRTTLTELLSWSANTGSVTTGTPW